MLLFLAIVYDAWAASESAKNRILLSLDTVITVGTRYIPMTDKSRPDRFSNGTELR